MFGYHICKSKKGDLEQILKIEEASFLDPWPRELFEAEFETKELSHFYVIHPRFRRAILGYVIFWKVADEMHILNIAVHPRYRRRGIGKLLLRATLDAYPPEQVRLIVLEVRRSNVAAQLLYKSFGFEVVEVKSGYYRNLDDALVMIKKYDESKTYS